MAILAFNVLTSKNANFEFPYESFFREIPMFGFIRKILLLKNIIIYQKNIIIIIIRKILLLS